MSIRYRLGCRLTYDVRQPAVFIFNIQVAALRRHTHLNEQLRLTPDLAPDHYIVPDYHNRYLRVHAPVGPLSLDYQAEVTLHPFRADPSQINETPVSKLPLYCVPYLLPSRFVPSDRLAGFARKEFGHLHRGYSRVTAICNWLFEHIDYRFGASDSQTTAAESLIRRAGVCRDFAHLGIAFCRALEIPARYVSCYAFGLKPNDFHAVFEAYLDGRWWLFDATRMAPLDGLIRIGAGRDAAEIALSSDFSGAVVHGLTDIHIERLDALPEGFTRTTDAISTDDAALELPQDEPVMNELRP